MIHPSIVSKKGFKFFLSACGIQIDPPQKKNVSDTLLPKLVEDRKSKVKRDLEGASWVALTVETWSYREFQTLLTMTAHFINDNWSMASYVLETFDGTEDRTGTLQMKPICIFYCQFNFLKYDCDLFISGPLTWNNLESANHHTNQVSNYLSIVKKVEKSMI